MKFWDDMSPVIRRSIIAGVLLLGVLFVVRQVASTPGANVTHTRGILVKP